MTDAMREVIIKRIQGYLWKLGGLAVVGLFALVLDIFNILQFSPSLVGIVGLAFSELTKFLYVNLPKLKLKEGVK